MIIRELHSEVTRLSQSFRVVAITGPRQSGKTTLCKMAFPNYVYFNLDRVDVVEEIEKSPEDFLKQYGKNGVVLDEVQNYPSLFPYIKVVVDENPDYRFVLTGSSNFLLLAKITESLAGRVALTTLLPLSLSELGEHAGGKTDDLLFKGGYPAIWSDNILPQDIVGNYYNTYIERDVRQIINIKDRSKFQIFIRLCAGRTGSEFNASALSNEVGVSYLTIQEWLSVLEASYVIFRLPPFFKNIGKRLVKTPKIYFYDTALVCFLLGIEKAEQLKTHPLYGAIFENYVVLEFLKKRFNTGKTNNLSFYRDKSQREIDLVQEFGNEYHAYEIKSATSFHSDFTNNLEYLKNLLGDRLLSTKVIFDGTVELKTIINFRNIHLIDS
ncbi:MAG: ATP-binding protein [Bacteroidales bacterium]|jgi:predicted AAA+ superfamily ATPase|nr:ATP-binding protein [Bacteroidales bacterium]